MTDNLPPLPQTDWLLHMPAQSLPAGMVLVPVELLKRAESSLGSFCSDHGWGGADMDTMDAISSALAASPAQPVQPSETDNGISSEDWIEAAMRVYLIAGDTEQEAQECAEYQWGEMDMDDLCDPYEAAMADVEGRGPALQPQPVQPSVRTLTTRELADVTCPWADVWTDKSFGIANAAIAKFCEVNGIATPAQPKD